MPRGQGRWAASALRAGSSAGSAADELLAGLAVLACDVGKATRQLAIINAGQFRASGLGQQFRQPGRGCAGLGLVGRPLGLSQ